MPAATELWWPEKATVDLYRGLHRIVHAVAAEGGAVGWLAAPDEEESAAWVDSIMERVAAGDGAMCVALVDGVAQATGSWLRERSPVFRYTAEVTKIMAHPEARGLGLGRLVTAAVADHAEAAGIETLRLGVRGNNHLAIAIYEELGFREWGRIPNVIAVGDMRFDEIKMYRQAPKPPGVVWMGSQPEGPGASPRPA